MGLLCRCAGARTMVSRHACAMKVYRKDRQANSPNLRCKESSGVSKKIEEDVVGRGVLSVVG